MNLKMYARLKVAEQIKKVLFSIKRIQPFTAVQRKELSTVTLTSS